jgi:hypothetical protein
MTILPRQAEISTPGAWAARAGELAEWAWARLVNRVDAWGAYRPLAERGKTYTGRNGTAGTLGNSWTAPLPSQRGRVSLTPDVLRQHFAATLPEHVVGLHTTSSQNTSLWGAVEVDWHGPTSTGPEVNWRAAEHWYGELRQMGFRPLLTDSNGKGGYHLRALLREPVPAVEVWAFLQWLTGDFARLGLPKRPETFPKQKAVTEKNPYGNWLRCPGRHHTREHWSRVWDGSGWLDGEAAVASLLALTGDHPDLLLSPRIEAYLAKLPNLGEGQGRDDVGYHFACLLVRDFALGDDAAREWLRRWDGANNPPKGAAQISKWIANAHQYGRRAYGSGRTRSEGGGRAEQQAAVQNYQLGPLTLRPGLAHRSPSGKVSVPLAMLRDGQAIDHTTLTSSASGRAAVVKLLAGHLDIEPKARPEIGAVLGEILAAAVAELDRKAEGGGLRLYDILRGEVPAYWRFAYRTDRGGAWSEARGAEVGRAEFLAFTPGWLLDAAAQAADAPPCRLSLLSAVRAELEVLWPDLTAPLPAVPDADVPAEAAALRFHSALEALWNAPRVNERRKLDDGDIIVVSGSLASRARARARGCDQRDPAKTPWELIHPPFCAWWRPQQTREGEMVPRLAMRWTLTTQIGGRLPGVHDQASLTDLGHRYGLIDSDPGVPDRLAHGTRLAVLTADFSRELLDEPDEEEAGAEPPPGDSEGGVSPNRG